MRKVTLQFTTNSDMFIIILMYNSVLAYWGETTVLFRRDFFIFYLDQLLKTYFVCDNVINIIMEGRIPAASCVAKQAPWKDLPSRSRHCAILRALVTLLVTPPIQRAAGLGSDSHSLDTNKHKENALKPGWFEKFHSPSVFWHTFGSYRA